MRRTLTLLIFGLAMAGSAVLAAATWPKSLEPMPPRALSPYREEMPPYLMRASDQFHYDRRQLSRHKYRVSNAHRSVLDISASGYTADKSAAMTLQYAQDARYWRIAEPYEYAPESLAHMYEWIFSNRPYLTDVREIIAAIRAGAASTAKRHESCSIIYEEIEGQADSNAAAALIAPLEDCLKRWLYQIVDLQADYDSLDDVFETYRRYGVPKP